MKRLALAACLATPKVADAAVFSVTFSDYDLNGPGGFYALYPTSIDMVLTTEGTPFGAATRDLIDTVTGPADLPVFYSNLPDIAFSYIGRSYTSNSGGGVASSGITFGDSRVFNPGEITYQSVAFRFIIADIDAIDSMAGRRRNRNLWRHSELRLERL